MSQSWRERDRGIDDSGNSEGASNSVELHGGAIASGPAAPVSGFDLRMAAAKSVASLSDHLLSPRMHRSASISHPPPAVVTTPPISHVAWRSPVQLLECAAIPAQHVDKYVSMLSDNDIDPPLYPRLTDSILKDIGVVSIGHRVKIMAAVKAGPPVMTRASSTTSSVSSAGGVLAGTGGAGAMPPPASTMRRVDSTFAGAPVQPAQLPGGLLVESNYSQPASIEHLQDVYAALCVCRAVYEEDPLTTLSNDASFHGIDRANRSSDCKEQAYMIAESSISNTVFLGFAGTDNIRDVFVDLSFFPKPTNVGQFHQGFLNRAYIINIRPLIHILTQGRRLVLTGHSLGGAVACVVALRLFFEAPVAVDYIRRGDVKVVTFAQPAVGDQNLAQYVHEEGLSHIFHRFVLPEDLIPRLHFLTDKTRAVIIDVLSHTEKLTKGQGGLEALLGKVIGDIRRKAASKFISMDSFGLLYLLSGQDELIPLDPDNCAEWTKLPDKLTVDTITHHQVNSYMDAMIERIEKRLADDQLAPPLQPVRELDLTPSVDTCVVRSTGSNLKIWLRGMNLAFAYSVTISGLSRLFVPVYAQIVRMPEDGGASGGGSSSGGGGGNGNSLPTPTGGAGSTSAGSTPYEGRSPRPRTGPGSGAHATTMVVGAPAVASTALPASYAYPGGRQSGPTSGWISHYAEIIVLVHDVTGQVRTGSMVTGLSHFGAAKKELDSGIIKPFSVMCGTAATIARLPLRTLFEKCFVRSLMIGDRDHEGGLSRQLLDSLLEIQNTLAQGHATSLATVYAHYCTDVDRNLVKAVQDSRPAFASMQMIFQPNSLSNVGPINAAIHALKDRPTGGFTYNEYLHWLADRFNLNLDFIPDIEYYVEQRLLDSHSGSTSDTGHMRFIAEMHKLRKLLLRDFVLGVVGTSETGKSTLLSELWRLPSNPSAVQRTRKITFFHFHNIDQFYAIDFPGANSIDSRIQACYTTELDGIHRLVSVFIVVFECTHVERDQLELLQSIRKQGCPFVVCLNKADLWLQHLSTPQEFAAAYDSKCKLLGLSQEQCWLTALDPPASARDALRQHGVKGITEVRNWLRQQLVDNGVEKVQEIINYYV